MTIGNRPLLLMVVLLATIFFSFYVEAQTEDSTVLLSDNTILIGRREMMITIHFGEDCSVYRVDIESPVFLYGMTGADRGLRSEGQTIKHSIDLNPDVEEGTYTVPITFNYTTMDDRNVSLYFEEVVVCLLPYRIHDVYLPRYFGEDFVIYIEFFVHIGSVSFTMSGTFDIMPETARLVLNNIDPGNYTIRSKVKQGNPSNNLIIEQRKIGFDMVVKSMGSTIIDSRGYEMNDISDPPEDFDSVFVESNTWIIGMVITLLILTNYMIYRYRKSSLE